MLKKLRKVLHQSSLEHQRSQPIEVRVQIPFSEKAYEDLQNLHHRAGNIFTVGDLEQAVAEAVRQRLGFETVSAQVTSNPNWSGRK